MTLHAPRSTLVRKLSLPNGANITNDFDSVARLLSTTLRTSAGALLNSHSYSYNPANQRTQQVFGVGNYVNYAYDPAGQLTSALGKEPGGTTNRLQERFSYVYDAAGNLNWRTNNALVQRFNVNNLNDLTTATNSGTLTVAGNTSSAATNVTVNTSNAVLYTGNTFASTNHSLADGNNTFTAIAKDANGRRDTNVTTVDLPVTNIFVYDLNGNLRTNGAQILDYDDENQLITNRAPNAWKSEFLYDGLHRRRIERDYGWNGSSWTLTNELRFIYDGSLIVQERDGNNLPETTLTRGLDLSGTFQGAGGIGGLLALTEQANNLLSPLCYHSDGNGSVTCLVNTNQLIVAQYLYDPFGKPLATWGPKANVNRYRFSSKPTNGRVGLYDFFRRWFAADLQRWITRDPIGEDGGIDLYEFCRNSPIDWFDPDGRGPTTKQGSEGHGNCLSYVLKQDDDKEGGIKPTKEEKANYGGIDPWLEAKLRAAGCREKGSSPCEKNESQVASLTGITKDDQGKDTFFFHVLVKRCGSEHWSERNGYNGPIVLDPDPVEKRQPGLKDRKAKQWCCPCKSR